ncbi:DUF4402 domain-containing protein [Telluria aromaticivorans]|uniref:DUF4402 domain-containing protein n=1 Tax=Telluria aromaticivorans TaxID=2725995 RepID=A0A7Y2JXX7_9BURK|nr:DUF4402 domain-containing protein [Telluria aromaticivorans]NNG23000.1 DUF4402 domain-containing protein [Telluria aromaticivorans]
MTKHARFTSTHLPLAALAVAVAVAAGSAHAASTQAATSSTVITPINIVQAADLSFGNFASGGAPGTVTVSPNNSRGVTGGVTGMAGGSTAAQFTVTGQGTSTYSINVVGTALTSGGNSMAFTPITDLTASAITTGTVTAGALTGGTQTIFVGGVLTVGANQAPGSYSGTVTATVDYN